MAHDAHCHPFDLRRTLDTDAAALAVEQARRDARIACAASAWNEEDFAYNESLAAGAAPVALTFALHPQAPASAALDRPRLYSLLALSEELAAAGRLNAIGECGFDLFDEKFRATEKLQDEIFAFELELALKHGLPLVLHVRRAMHKVFALSAKLRKLPAVIFHSYSGTAEEAHSLIRRGVNAYFSFGNGIINGNKKAQKSCAACDADRILFETDAPYQSRLGCDYSVYSDVYEIIKKAAVIKNIAPRELEEHTDKNFFKIFFGSSA
jgi:TatD DNase family protein